MMRIFAILLAAAFAFACGDDGGGGTPTDGGIDGSTVDADPNAPDARPDAAPAAAVDCGGATCTDVQECCQTGFPDPVLECVDTGTCAGQLVTCDGPSDCPDVGQVCCRGLQGDKACGLAEECTVPSTVACEVPADCPEANEDCCEATGSCLTTDFDLCGFLSGGGSPP